VSFPRDRAITTQLREKREQFQQLSRRLSRGGVALSRIVKPSLLGVALRKNNDIISEFKQLQRRMVALRLK